MKIGEWVVGNGEWVVWVWVLVGLFGGGVRSGGGGGVVGFQVVVAAVLWVRFFFFFFFFFCNEIDFWIGCDCDCDCGGSGDGFGCGGGWVWWLAMVGVWCLIVLMFRLLFVLH